MSVGSVETLADVTDLRHIRRTITFGEVTFLCTVTVPYDSPESRASLPPQHVTDVLPSNTCPACLERHRKK